MDESSNSLVRKSLANFNRFILLCFLISIESTDSCKEAVEFTARQRRMQTPPLYNPAKAEEMPLPNILPPVLANADELIEQALSIPCLVVIEQNPNIVAARTDDEEQHDNNNDGDNEALFEPLIQYETENQEVELDPLALFKQEPIDPLHDDDIDEIANDIICTEEAVNDVAEADNQDVNQTALENSVQNDGFEDENNENNAEGENNDVREEFVFEKFNEELSIAVGEMPLPILVGLQLKTNDDFSGKMCFVEFVSVFASKRLKYETIIKSFES